MIHIITKKDKHYYLGPKILIVTYPEGDCDLLDDTNIDQKLIGVLYDEYQMSDDIKNGDVFSLNGVTVAHCIDTQVIPVKG